ncbi:ABC-three component system protein [Galbibacter sp. PAP.153]|uniref:ABC-three component system protein n=1 Tax=Galbibacter sp. PAP.153 TaxID=3104623 RepID=UPI00300BA74E
MSNNKTHIEKTAAESKSIGFDYQYYFFLWKVLLLKPNESVGLEVIDDVHTDLGNNLQVLYQLKHTVKKNSKGDIANLTTSDLDMWKTFSNWSKVICDTNDARSTKQAQLNFIEKTSFVLASNKSSNKSNEIVKIISHLQSGTKKINEIRTHFLSLEKNTKNEDLKGYIKDVLSLDELVLEQFLLNTFFHLDDDDIITKCKEAIKSKMIPQEKIEKAFSTIDSSIRSDNFLQVKEGVKIEITFEDLYKKFRRQFDLYRNGSLDVQEYKGALPNNLEEQVFIKQLEEIGFVKSCDSDYITKLTLFKLKLINNLDEWKRDGNVTELELERFKKDAFNLWDTEFRIQHVENINEEDYNKKGVELLRSVLKERLKLAEQELDIDLCHGNFYSLSDEPVIGWRKDWEKHKK